MIKTLIEFSQKHSLLPRGSRVLCAVSGGADSVSLLYALNDLQNELGISVCAAHYNHMIRDTAGRDEEFVRSLCRKLDIPLICGGGDVPARARESGMGLEETARQMRYEFLNEAADGAGASLIATAHTADDNMETIIMNLARGSGTLGAAGIPPKRGRVIRPLLTVTRAQIEKYLAGLGAEHVEDETNADESYARNKVRRRVSPVLRELNPKAAENFSKAALRLRQDAELLDELAGKVAEAAAVESGSVTIPVSALLEAPYPLAFRALKRLFAGISQAPLSAAHIAAMMELAEGEDPSAQVDLPGGIMARREYEHMVIAWPPEPKTFKPLTLTAEGDTEIPELGLAVTCRRVKNDKKIHNSVNTFCFDCDMIKNNFVLRPRREGDRITLPGRKNKSLKKLFIEEKIPKHLRGMIPVLADDAGVMAVVGLGVNADRYPRGAEDIIYVEVKDS